MVNYWVQHKKCRKGESWKLYAHICRLLSEIHCVVFSIHLYWKNEVFGCWIICILGLPLQGRYRLSPFSTWFVALKKFSSEFHTHEKLSSVEAPSPLLFFCATKILEIDGKCKMKMFLLKLNIYNLIVYSHMGKTRRAKTYIRTWFKCKTEVYWMLLCWGSLVHRCWGKRKKLSVAKLVVSLSPSGMWKLFICEARMKDWQRSNNFVTIVASFISKVSPWWWRYSQYFDWICMQSCREIYKHLFWLYLRWGREKKRRMGEMGKSFDEL
jgi:hypothetical protein